MDARRHTIIYLSAAVFTAACLVGCSSIRVDDPHSPSFATVRIDDDHGINGSAPQPLIQIIQIKTASGFESADFPGENPHVLVLYLKPGRYTVQGDCRRNWPNTPVDGVTYRLPHGLGTDDSSETFTIVVEAGQRYVLYCIPGMNKSEFKLAEILP